VAFVFVLQSDIFNGIGTMQKDFDRWNEVKKRLEGQARKILFREGVIWWCSVGINVTYEICGKGLEFRRPVLVLKKLSGSSFIGVPMSSKPKDGSWFMRLLVKDKQQTLLLHQVRMFSANRFESRLATAGEEELRSVRNGLRELLSL
jgi:mRNA interferase MazF